MNDRFRTHPLTRAVRIGDDISVALPSFLEVLGEVPQRLDNIQGIVNSIVSSLKDIDVSSKMPHSRTKPEAEFNDVLEQVLDFLPQLHNIVEEYTRSVVFDREQWDMVASKEANQLAGMLKAVGASVKLMAALVECDASSNATSASFHRDTAVLSAWFSSLASYHGLLSVSDDSRPLPEDTAELYTSLLSKQIDKERQVNFQWHFWAKLFRNRFKTEWGICHGRLRRISLPVVVYQCVRCLLRSTRVQWEREKGPFWNSTSRYSSGAVIVPGPVKKLSKPFGKQQNVDLLASKTLTSTAQDTEASLINIGQLLYYYLCAQHIPIISAKRRMVIETKLKPDTKAEEKVSILKTALQPNNFSSAEDYLLSLSSRQLPP